jgi:hypothetical protein
LCVLSPALGAASTVDSHLDTLSAHHHPANLDRLLDRDTTLPRRGWDLGGNPDARSEVSAYTSQKPARNSVDSVGDHGSSSAMEPVGLPRRSMLVLADAGIEVVKVPPRCPRGELLRREIRAQNQNRTQTGTVRSSIVVVLDVFSEHSSQVPLI